MRHTTLAAWTLMALASPTLAWSQSRCATDENRVRIEDARNRIFTDRPDRVDYEGAERGLRFAARDCPTDPEVNGLMGLALLGMQSYVLAEQHLQRAENFHDENPTWWRQNGAVVTARLAMLRQTLGSLLVTVDAPDAVLHLADERVVALPMRLPVRVPAGRFTLRITAPGREPRTLETEIEPDRVARLSASLAPIPSAAPEVRVMPAERVLVPVHVERRASPWRTVGWISAGVGAAALIVGAVEWSVSNSQQSQAFASNADSPGAWGAWARYSYLRGSPDASTVCDYAGRDPSADALSVRDLCAENQRTRTAAWVLSAVGAVLLGGGLATALLAPERTTETTPSARVTASVGSSPRVSLEVRF